MTVCIAGRNVEVRLELLYDEHDLKFFRRLTEKDLRARTRLSFT